MGDGTASGIGPRNQLGVLQRPGESFPHIPSRLLRLSPEELQRRIDIASEGLLNHYCSPWASKELIRGCEEHRVNLEFAKTAVERQRTGKEQK